MKIKAIFFDIDGTLVSFESHSIPPSTKKAIETLRQKDIKLIIATGRPLCDINNLEDLQFDGYITANGAYCVTDKNELLSYSLIPQDNLNRLVEYHTHTPFPCIFLTDKGNFANYIDDSVIALNQMVNLPLPEVRPMTEILKHNIFQIDAFITKEEELEVFSDVLTDCQGSRWHPTFVDINLKNNNKATGIDAFLKYYDLEIQHTMAFGDGGNDIPMLKHVAIGIAMGNASDEVKASANYVTTSVDENGILEALKHFNLLS